MAKYRGFRVGGESSIGVNFCGESCTLSSENSCQMQMDLNSLDSL